MVGASFSRTTMNDAQRRANKNGTVQPFIKMDMTLNGMKMNGLALTERI